MSTDSVDAIETIAAVEPAQWPRRIRVLHWIGAVLILTVLGAILSREIIEDGDLRGTLLNLHKQLGIAVLAYTVLRLGFRAGTRVIGGLHTRWVRIAAYATHAATYFLMLALPVLGWMFTNAKGKPVTLLGIPLPSLVAKDRDFAETLQSWHETLGWTLLILIGLHVVAALWHHFIVKDDVLRAMLGKNSSRLTSDSPPDFPPPTTTKG